MAAASSAVSRRDESDGISNGGVGLFKKVFTDVLRDIGKQKSPSSARSTSSPAAFELKPECCDGYDPTFFHLRRQEHQHAMDNVDRLRKQKFGVDKDAGQGIQCLPIVSAPPKSHPRFLPCRLLLHLSAMDAALRRYLLFALTGGSWLPPTPPEPKPESIELMQLLTDADSLGAASTTRTFPGIGSEVAGVSFGPRGYHRQATSGGASFSKRVIADLDPPTVFSPEVVAASSVSLLEVLQLLTLQIHTLEECASLHRIQQDLDDEAKYLSAGLSINSYLGRLIWVPDSLEDVWALRPFPGGPLPSKGSGEKRGSLLGLLIALYEHKSDHGGGQGTESTPGQSEGHGGARALASSGLKWLLRFVNALVDGAQSVGAAAKSATTGSPVSGSSTLLFLGVDSGAATWTIDAAVRSTISSMLVGLRDLWPKKELLNELAGAGDKSNTRTKEARKAAQLRVMELMKQKQKAFAATIAPTEQATGTKADGARVEDESDLCIICKCDDADGENNGPLGYLGHVQRSRVAQMRSTIEAVGIAKQGFKNYQLFQSYRVVGHRGCQLRESESMDSKPLLCLPRGSIVTVLKSAMSDNYDIVSRRVYVRHVAPESASGARKVSEGWASVQSAKGYIILSPLHSLCHTNTRWGNTRPIIKQCGHAAHLKCVETHTLSLHQRAAGDQPYDGRFAANIQDGEFLCPLCKQLSNILIPRDGRAKDDIDAQSTEPLSPSHSPVLEKRTMRQILTNGSRKFESCLGDMGKKALRDFASHLLQAMDVPWKRVNAARKKRQQKRWHPAIQRWDYEEEDDTDSASNISTKSVLRLLRQQHIAWAAVGYTAAAAEAGSRGVEEVLPFGSMSRTSDPWTDYNEETKDCHPSLLELKRTLSGASGLLELVIEDATMQLLGSQYPASEEKVSVVCSCIADILDGRSWLEAVGVDRDDVFANREFVGRWSQLTALMTCLPCHVARDGMISRKHEARAVAAAMWVVRGVGTMQSSISEPPVPLAVSEMYSSMEPPPSLPSNWGTMSPFAADAGAIGNSSGRDTWSFNPFRPAVASAFLYTPLLSWDLNSFAGAAFSMMLLNDFNDLPKIEDLLNAAQTLLLCRVVQTIITPTGLIFHDDMDVGDDDGFWSAEEMQLEGTALVKLASQCRSMISARANEGSSYALAPLELSDSSLLFSAIATAILPFARTLILLLRACTAVIRQRQRRDGQDIGKATPADNLLNRVMLSSELMSSENGFRFMKEIGGPLPSNLIDQSSDWGALINRWLVAAVGWDLHHGSSGRSVLTRYSANSVANTDSQQGGIDITSKLLQPSTPNRYDMDTPWVMLGTTLRDSMETEERHRSVGAPTEGGAADVFDAETDGDMEVEESERPSAAGSGDNQLGLDDLDDSDEELIDDIEMDEAEEMIGFAEQALGDFAFGLARHSPSSEAPEDSSDDSCSSDSKGGDVEDRQLAFANSGRSPIMPYQPSFLGLHSIGPGRKDIAFESATASAVMTDLSHLGLIHRKDWPTFSLIRLPKSFVELYTLVSKVKGRDDSAGLEDSDDVGNTETAICLLTGEVMRAGSARRPFNRTTRRPGACTMHARKNGSGIGIFFLVQKCTVLLMHNSKSAYSPSIYVDEHGEEDPNLHRGRPLYLNEARYRALEMLWRQQGIPREVAQIRSTSDRVIRDDWY